MPDALAHFSTLAAANLPAPDVVILPDTNEFHPLEQYAGPAAILRAMHDVYIDKAFLGDAGRASTFQWWAVYQYLTAGADVERCAAALKQLLAAHGLRPNATITDIEAGDGNQGPRQAAWLAAMADDPADDETYSGDFFARAHNLETGAKFWIAAYQRNEPTTAHFLWQFSDAYTFPGISAPCDASIFHGTINDLIALTSGKPLPEGGMAELDNRVFYAKRKGNPAVQLVGIDGRFLPRHVTTFRVAELVCFYHGWSLVAPPALYTLVPIPDGEGQTRQVAELVDGDILRLP